MRCAIGAGLRSGEATLRHEGDAASRAWGVVAQTAIASATA